MSDEKVKMEYGEGGVPTFLLWLWISFVIFALLYIMNWVVPDMSVWISGKTNWTDIFNN
jgi:hypothetical protein